MVVEKLATVVGSFSSLLFWGWAAVYFVSVFCYYLHSGEWRGKSLVGFFTGYFRFCFPLKVYQTISSRDDLKIFLFYIGLSFVPGFAFLSGANPFIDSVQAKVFGGVQALFPQLVTESTLPYWAYVVLLALALDFGNFLSHFVMHKVPFLWNFHKVHHSSTALTPLTQFRSHPVEPALKLIFMAASGGTLEGVLLASGAITSDMYMVSFGHIWLCYLIFLLTIHLRHSQHGMSFGPYLSYLFSSPSMHHIHHSTNREHIDKNFAIVFSFWDWIFGSFYLPTQNETFRIGLTDQEEEKRFQGLRNHLVEPFLCLLRRKSRPMRQDDQKDSAA